MMLTQSLVINDKYLLVLNKYNGIHILKITNDFQFDQN